jgi:uncharacterized membrane protein
MRSARVEAFSDGVVAIIITIMVLEMRAPHGASLADLRPVAPAFLSYVLSFVYLGIYWNNHHHLMHVVRHVDGRVMWANLHLLFWLSLVPFVTAWMGENHFAAVPVALYGGVLLMAAVAYWLLVRALLARHGPDSLLARAIGSGVKENLSLLAYVVAIALAYPARWVACAIYVGVASLWLVPDRRIERVLAEAGGERP